MTPLKWVIAAVGLVAAAFIVVLAVQNVQQNGPNFDLVGKSVPPVQGISASGESVDLDLTLQANRTKAPNEQTWTAVNFFASWCSGCVVEHQALVQFNEEGANGANGARCSTQLLGVAFNDEKEAVKGFFEKFGGDWPVLIGKETNQIAIDFSVLTAPETFLVAPSGLIVLKVVGPVTYEKLIEGVSC